LNSVGLLCGNQQWRFSYVDQSDEREFILKIANNKSKKTQLILM
jgi:hypothetical protein